MTRLDDMYSRYAQQPAQGKLPSSTPTLTLPHRVLVRKAKL